MPLGGGPVGTRSPASCATDNILPVGTGIRLTVCGGKNCARGQDEQMIEQSAQPSSEHCESSQSSAQSSSKTSAIHLGAPLIDKTSMSAIT